MIKKCYNKKGESERVILFEGLRKVGRRGLVFCL